MRELTAELSQGSQEYEKLTSYIQQYQANAIQKVTQDVPTKWCACNSMLVIDVFAIRSVC